MLWSRLRQDERRQQQGQVNNRPDKQQTRSFSGADSQKPHGNSNKQTAQYQFDGEIRECDDSDKCRQTSQNQEQNTKKHALTGAAFTAEVIARNHAKTRSRIVFAVHPCNGEEMRQLPKHKNYKKTPCPS